MVSCMDDTAPDMRQIRPDEPGDTACALVPGGPVSAKARNTGPETGCSLVET